MVMPRAGNDEVEMEHMFIVRAVLITMQVTISPEGAPNYIGEFD